MITQQLPDSWELTSLSEIVVINPAIDKKSIDDETLVSFVPMPAVEAESGRIDISIDRPFKDVKKGYTGFLERDVIFAKITPCMENGKMAVIPKLKNNLGFGSTEFHVLRTLEGIAPEFLYHYVSSKWFRVEAEHNMTGAVGQRRVPTSFLETSHFPLPPFNEQKRIVAKIEELFSELDNGIASLKTARAQLKVYRQAVLKHAFEGKLTEKWREVNVDKLESPEQLLARIQQKREAYYQQQLEEWKTAVKGWEANGKDGKKPTKPKKLVQLTLVADASSQEFPQLPYGWSYVKLGNLIDEPTYGTSAKCEYETGEQSVLRIPNISAGKIDDSDLKFASFEKGEVDHLRLLIGDILTIRSNGSISLVGCCAFINEKDTKHIFAGYLIRLRPNHKTIKSEYLLSVMSSHFLRKQIESAAKSTSGVNNINSGELQNLTLPLPSIEEQELIIREVAKKLDSVNRTLGDIELQLRKAEILRQSILKKAFSGQLVPQASKDEPASELLARIRAEKASPKAAFAPIKARAKAGIKQGRKPKAARQ